MNIFSANFCKTRLYCGEHEANGNQEFLAIAITNEGEVACKAETNSVCQYYNDKQSCLNDIAGNTWGYGDWRCGENHEVMAILDCTGYDSCSSNVDEHLQQRVDSEQRNFCYYQRQRIALETGVKCLLNNENGWVYGIGFDRGDMTCFANDDWSCKTYVNEDDCYRDMFLDNWSKVLTCGDFHQSLLGCNGYDGCASGKHWCKYFDKYYSEF